MSTQPSKLVNWLSRLRTILTAPTPIGGLEISTTSLKYLLLRNNSIVQASLRLPPGIIEAGKIKNTLLLEQALRDLHAQILPLSKPISVVLCLPQSTTYTQAFTVPIIASGQMVESVMLNLQMISPTNIEDSFYDYQEVQERSDTGQFELLGAFAQKSVVQEYANALKNANFIPVVVCFPALAIARLIRLRWGGLATTEDYLVLYVSSEGVLTLILKNGNLSFDRFTPWHEITKEGSVESLTFSQIKEFIAEDMRRVLNFYLGRTGKQLTNAILISPVFNYELITLLQERLNITLHNLAIAELPKLQPSWFSVLGSATRGSMPRSKDTEISLTPENSQTEYLEQRIVDFIKLWRNIIASTLVFVLAAFTFTNIIFDRQQNYLERRLQTEFNTPALTGNTAVQEKIQNFNQQVDIISQTQQSENNLTPLLEIMQKTAGKDIVIKKMSVDPNLNFIINGNAKADDLAFAFLNRILNLSFVQSADLPIKKVVSVGENSVFFDDLRGVFKEMPTGTIK